MKQRTMNGIINRTISYLQAEAHKIGFSIKHTNNPHTLYPGPAPADEPEEIPEGFKLSPAQYVKEGGSICPACLVNVIEYDGSPDGQAGELWQPVQCKACGTRWNETATLTGYEPIE